MGLAAVVIGVGGVLSGDSFVWNILRSQSRKHTHINSVVTEVRDSQERSGEERARKGRIE